MMRRYWFPHGLYALLIVFLCLPFTGMAQTDQEFPPVPNPPRLVNDLAGMMSPAEQQQLEEKLREFDKTTSTQITIVTIKNLGGYDVQQYAVELAQRWGIGRKGKDNGVLILASKDDRKINISTGYGLEGVLTDGLSGRIIRNEITPEFKAGNFYKGFDKAAEAIIAATKGEYTADAEQPKGKLKAGNILLVIIIVVVIIIAISKRGGGSSGGGYMSGRGSRDLPGDLLTGLLLGNLLGGGRGGGGGWGGGSSGGGGGFGGFGGGSFGGGGASGSW